MAKIGIADTTFARINLAKFAVETINKNSDHLIERYTVPGFKDLPVACKILVERYKCDIVIALGMAGTKEIDKQCSHEASMSLQSAQLLVGKHILEVFIHPDEAKSETDLLNIAKDRSAKHAMNALALLEGKEALSKNAGMGKRQGKSDEGPLNLKK
jgi:riboflavin synthase